MFRAGVVLSWAMKASRIAVAEPIPGHPPIAQPGRPIVMAAASCAGDLLDDTLRAASVEWGPCGRHIGRAESQRR